MSPESTQVNFFASEPLATSREVQEAIHALTESSKALHRIEGSVSSHSAQFRDLREKVELIQHTLAAVNANVLALMAGAVKPE